MKTRATVALLVGGVLYLLVAVFLDIERGPRTDHVSIYVAVRNGETQRFVGWFSALMKSAGFRPSTGYATDDQGKVVTVVEALGGNSRIWMSNILLSGEEAAPECGRHFEAYPDPQQFEIRVRKRFRSIPSDNVAKLVDMMKRRLDQEWLKHGDDPWLCGAMAFRTKEESSAR